MATPAATPGTAAVAGTAVAVAAPGANVFGRVAPQPVDRVAAVGRGVSILQDGCSAVVVGRQRSAAAWGVSSGVAQDAIPSKAALVLPAEGGQPGIPDNRELPAAGDGGLEREAALQTCKGHDSMQLQSRLRNVHVITGKLLWGTVVSWIALSMAIPLRLPKFVA